MHTRYPGLVRSVLAVGLTLTIFRLSSIARSGAAPEHPNAVYFVPIGSSAVTADRIADLRRFYRATLHLECEVLPVFSGLTAWNPSTRQWTVEALVDQLIEREEIRLRSGHITIIGITGDDLYSTRDGWTFAWRTGARVALVSYARMASTADVDGRDAVLDARLRKFVSKYIGVLHFELPMTGDRKSPTYSGIDGLAALDGMSEDLGEAGFLSVRPLLDYRAPVDLATGLYTRYDTDLTIDDEPKVTFYRAYRSNNTQLPWLPFGIGTNHGYGTFLIGDAATFSFIDLVMENGARIHYRRVSPGTGHTDAVFEHDETPSQFLHSRLSWNDGSWLVELRNGSSYRFPGCAIGTGKPCTLSVYRDPSGRQIRMRFDDRRNPVEIESEHHRTIGLAYNDHDRVVTAWDDVGNRTTYQYDARDRLIATNASGRERQEYGYDEQNQLVVFRQGSYYETMTYDAAGRCSKFERRRLYYVDGAGHPFERRDSFAFDYRSAPPEADTAKRVSVDTVSMTGPDGQRQVSFNPSGYSVLDVYGVGTAFEQRTVLDRHPQTNALQRVTVTCAGARRSTVVEDVSQGQSEDVIVTRARRGCDIAAARTAPTDP